MDHEPDAYTPVNIPTSGPVNYRPPDPHEMLPVKTPTDRRLRHIFTKPWLLTIIGLILIIALFNAYSLYSQNRKQKQNSISTPNPTTTTSCAACPQFMPPAPDFCQDGSLIPGPVDACGCQLPPTCQHKID